MPMTLDQMEAGILELEREIEVLRGSLDYQQSVAAIREALALIGDGKGRPVSEVVADLRQRKALARASS